MALSKLTTLLLSAAFASTALTSAFAASGYIQQTLSAAHRSVEMDLHVWYPTDETDGQQVIGKNALFKGVTVIPEAMPLEGQHPIVVLSHGSGGNAVNIAWLAIALAEAGHIVLAVNHPNSTSRNSIPEETAKLWERPMDVTAMLDHVQSGGLSSLGADLTRVAAIGFSLGGHTALALAGAQVNQQMYIEYCDNNVGLLDCKWFQEAGVDFKTIDKTRYEQSNRDPRITAAVAIDPAVAPAYTKDSLNQVKVPVQIISLGAKENIPLAVMAEEVNAQLPDSTLHYIPDAWHFSFLGECTTMGSGLVWVIGEDPICEEAAGGKRPVLHKQMKTLITEFLDQNL